MASYSINPNYKLKVLEISGRFTIENRDEFQAFIKENIDFSTPGTIIDATELGYIDSSGIGELLRFKMGAAKTNHVIYIVGLSEAILKMFKMSQLNHVFTILSKEEFERDYKA